MRELGRSKPQLVGLLLSLALTLPVAVLLHFLSSSAAIFQNKMSWWWAGDLSAAWVKKIIFN